MAIKQTTYFYQPQGHDEEIYKKRLPPIGDDIIIGFLDEASPQTTSNTQWFWSFCKSKMPKNMDKYKANAFLDYAAKLSFAKGWIERFISAQ